MFGILRPRYGSRGAAGYFLNNGSTGIPKKSVNGAVWTNLVGPAGVQLLFFASLGQTVVAFASNGQLYRSTNGGESWTATGHSPSGGVRGIAGGITASGRCFVTCPNYVNPYNNFGPTNCSYSLDDGVTWQEVSAGVGNNYITFGADLFVVIKDYGPGSTGVMTSPTGAVWTNRSGASGIHIAWNGKHLLAVGNGGYCYSSPDALNWTLGSAPGGNQWSFTAVAGGVGYFCAGTNNGNGSIGIYKTTDLGKTWAYKGAYGAYTSAASDGRDNLVFGQNSTMYSLDRGETWAAGSNADFPVGYTYITNNAVPTGVLHLSVAERALRLWLKMDAPGSAVRDYSVYDHPMTALGNAAIVAGAGPDGVPAAVFDGTGDYITSPKASTLEFATMRFAVEVQFKLTNVGDMNTLLYYGPVAGSDLVNYEMLQGGVNPLLGKIEAVTSLLGGAGNYTYSQAALLSGIWYTAKMWRSRSGYIFLSINNVPQNKTSIAAAALTTHANAVLRIGRDLDGLTPDRDFEGAMSRVKIWGDTDVEYDGALLHLTWDLIDSVNAIRNWYVGAGSVTYDTGQFVFADRSLKFNPGYIEYDDFTLLSLPPGTDDFTYEGFCRAAVLGNTGLFTTSMSLSHNGIGLGYWSGAAGGGKWQLSYGAVDALQIGTPIVINQWYYFCVMRKAGRVYVHIGQPGGNAVCINPGGVVCTRDVTDQGLAVGAYFGVGTEWNGWMTSFRFRKECVYVPDIDFVVPSKPFQGRSIVLGLANMGTTSAVGHRLAGLQTTDVIKLWPITGLYVAWSGWNTDVGHPTDAWSREVQVTTDSGQSMYHSVLAGTAREALAAAQASGSIILTGSTSYTFWIGDTPTYDNRGGMDFEVSYSPAAPAYLDDLPVVPRTAWGYRKLYRNATVSVRVRRSSDNAEADIGFISNALDSAALLTHVGAGDGFIATWYDQTGNGYHWQQPTTTKQAKIVSAGALLPAAEWDGVDDYYSITSLPMGTPYVAFVAKMQQTLDAAGRVVLETSTDANANAQSLYFATQASVYTTHSTNAGSAGFRRINQFSLALSSVKLLTLMWDRTLTGTNEMKAWVDGTAVGGTSYGAFNVDQTGNFNPYATYLGGRYLYSEYANMKLEAGAIYTADIASYRTLIEAIMAAP